MQGTDWVTPVPVTPVIVKFQLPYLAQQLETNFKTAKKDFLKTLNRLTTHAWYANV